MNVAFGGEKKMEFSILVRYARYRIANKVSLKKESLFNLHYCDMTTIPAFAFFFVKK